jgi:hypothetical protein
VELDGIAYYPVPADGQITLNKPAKHVLITDMLGKVVVSAENVQRINTANIPTGAYLITLNHRATGRLLIQH